MPPPSWFPTGRCLVAQRRLDIVGPLIGWLREAGHEVATATTARETLERFAGWHPHALIIDAAFPDMDGVAVCRTVRERSPIPIVFVADQPDIGERLRAFESGADDYLPPDIQPQELGARLAATFRRAAQGPDGSRGSDDVIRVGPIRLDRSRHQASRGDKTLDLTPTEFAVLSVLMSNAGTVVTRSTLLDAVWGEETAPSSNVVDRHIRTLRRKLESGSLTRRPSEFIETVSRVGYRMRPDVLETLAWASGEAS